MKRKGGLPGGGTKVVWFHKFAVTVGRIRAKKVTDSDDVTKDDRWLTSDFFLWRFTKPGFLIWNRRWE